VENTSKPKQVRRSLRNLLIEPFKQVRFGLYILAITLSFLVICSLILVNSFIEQYRHVLTIFNVVDPRLRWEFIADEIFYANIFRLVVCFSIFALVLFSTVFKLTHRFYGPIVALKRTLVELNNGNYATRVRLRKKDELQEIASGLNTLAESLERKKKEQK
jgi:HAMP domain-containing protein